MSEWKNLPLGELCEVTAGGTPSRTNPVYFGGGIPWVKIGDMLQGRITSTEETISRKGLENSAAKLLPPGTVLVSIFATIGRTAVLDIEAATNQAIAGVTPRNPNLLESNYLRYFLDNIANSLERSARGVAQLNINSTILKALPIPLPPLEEQRRIAEVLDCAEELRSKRREAIAQLDTLTQAIFLEMFGDPVTNPKGWPSKALTDVCYCYSGGTPSKNNDAYWQGSLPWFSAKDLKFNDLFDSQDHINEDIPAKTTLKLLPKNTVVIVVRGMILAHTFPISVLRIPATINQDLKALLPNEPLEPQLLAASLRSVAAFALQQVSEAAHGTKRLDAESLRKIPIILPPLPLQQEFARRVEAVEKLKAAHRASLSELDALFASLQHRAFRGEL
ncbi:restriction endonuclease subunit S [Nostoc sp.]